MSNESFIHMLGGTNPYALDVHCFESLFYLCISYLEVQ